MPIRSQKIYFQEAIMFSRVESVHSVSSLSSHKQTDLLFD